tara:strand:+ start:2987 stop:3379 length:393 start_codon:yes stop_codon:yes gene_type:complete
MENNKEWNVIKATIMSYLAKKYQEDEDKCIELINGFYTDILNLFENKNELIEKIEMEKLGTAGRIRLLEQIRDYYASQDLFERCSEVNKVIRYYRAVSNGNLSTDEDEIFRMNMKYSTMTNIYYNENKTK